MKNRIGIRLEDKNIWERRVALVPDDVAELTGAGMTIWVERFPRRAYADQRYADAGAQLVDSVTPCELVLGIKEMPLAQFRHNGAYMFFSHTIKGQSYNMPLLAELKRQACTLFDYETIVDAQNRRLIFFGRFAGIAGMIDTLWTLGQRLQSEGVSTPFADLNPAHQYADLDTALAAVSRVGQALTTHPLPAQLTPLVVGITGYGNVSQGAQEVLRRLPICEVSPDDLSGFVAQHADLADKVVQVVYKERDLVAHREENQPFNLDEYYHHPGRYQSRFEPHLANLTVLVNGIYWDEKYPKLADAAQLKQLFSQPSPPRLRVVGDVTCDVDGSLACTVRDTEPGDPVYIYDPQSRDGKSGFDGAGLAVMAVGNLPCELPREASFTFSQALKPFLPSLGDLDFSADFDAVPLPAPIRQSTILWRGQFTPKYAYMNEYLK